MANAKLEMILTAHDRASAAFNSAARSADRLAKSQDHVNRSGKQSHGIMKGLAGLGAAVSLGAAGMAVKKFAQDSIKARWPLVWDALSHNGFDLFGFIRKVWPKRLPPLPKDNQ